MTSGTLRDQLSKKPNSSNKKRPKPSKPVEIPEESPVDYGDEVYSYRLSLDHRGAY